MERTKDVLKRKTVDRSDVVILIFVTKAGFPQPGINFISGGIRMGDAGDAPGRVNYRVDALKQFCHDNARLAATGARDKADVPIRRRKRIRSR